MPTYEYECTKCGHQFEKFQSMKDEPLKRCPKCRCKVKRMLGTGAGIIFKGSGFYQTDYRSSDYHAAAKKDSGSADTKPSTESQPAKTEKKESKPAAGNKAG
jgi:putative FmdB family regulatory protein